MDSRLQQQINFILEADKLKTVLRRNLLTDDSRRENSAEHSWHSILMAQILFEYADNKNELDLLHIIKMLTIHDIVEVYAGDTFMYDVEGYKDKFDRENKAAIQIFGLLPEDQRKEYYELWLEFENEETPNAQFAAMTDKMMPVIINTYNGGTSWREANISCEQVIESQKNIANGPEVFKNLLQELIGVCRKNGNLV